MRGQDVKIVFTHHTAENIEPKRKYLVHALHNNIRVKFSLTAVGIFDEVCSLFFSVSGHEKKLLIITQQNLGIT